MLNIKNIMSKRIGDFLFLLGLFGVVGIVLVSTWAVLEVLRQLGAWLFIDQNATQYVRLDPNIAINSFPNSLFVLAYVLGVWALATTAKDEYWRMAKKKRGRGALRAKWPWMIRWTAMRLIKLTAVILLLCLPGINTYTIVTSSAILEKSYFSLHADVFPLSQLTKIECVAGKVVTTNLEFSDGRSLFEQGFRKNIYEGIAQARGIPLDYGSCRGHF